MKTAQLPPVRVPPAVRQAIESVLLEGETLSQFVEQATVQAARRRKAQLEFVERGRASLAQARATGDLHDAVEALSAMQQRLAGRMGALRQGS
ncbi:MAG: YlcI/YnfO family protein [Acidovorax sp.]|uniref:YlcI/YnfO family protein n=1 Tax=Acidovorax sp. TaxID=1872122 RepID=UPI0039E3E9D8